MTATLSPADQHALINDGLAIGCTKLGVAGISPNTQYLDLAFKRAIRDFPARAMFGQVRPDAIRGILAGHPRRKMAYVVWRRGEAWWWPDFSRGFDAEELADLLEEIHGTRAGIWPALARPFIDSLGEQNLLRHA